MRTDYGEIKFTFEFTSKEEGTYYMIKNAMQQYTWFVHEGQVVSKNLYSTIEAAVAALKRRFEGYDGFFTEEYGNDFVTPVAFYVYPDGTVKRTAYGENLLGGRKKLPYIPCGIGKTLKFNV